MFDGALFTSDVHSSLHKIAGSIRAYCMPESCEHVLHACRVMSSHAGSRTDLCRPQDTQPNAAQISIPIRHSVPEVGHGWPEAGT